ncbi:hypothetical protein WR25_11509 [Diploscapter pachys]|uniref:Uncharacterized protein n=1 Tax=Diploscapter pachys TaxID=2018661 RepID=A0A2A2JK70_9BILA|nr:hypothetical protein WR25_11509 [Diploscapter pachys]
MDGRRDEESREGRKGIGDERAGDVMVDDRQHEREGGERDAERGETGDEEITEMPCSSSAQATDTPSIIHLGDTQPHKQTQPPAMPNACIRCESSRFHAKLLLQSTRQMQKRVELLEQESKEMQSYRDKMGELNNYIDSMLEEISQLKAENRMMAGRTAKAETKSNKMDQKMHMVMVENEQLKEEAKEKGQYRDRFAVAVEMLKKIEAKRVILNEKCNTAVELAKEERRVREEFEAALELSRMKMENYERNLPRLFEVIDDLRSLVNVFDLVPADLANLNEMLNLRMALTGTDQPKKKSRNYKPPVARRDEADVPMGQFIADLSEEDEAEQTVREHARGQQKRQIEVDSTPTDTPLEQRRQGKKRPAEAAEQLPVKRNKTARPSIKDDRNVQFFDSFVKALQAFDEESYPPVADFSIPPYFFREGEVESGQEENDNDEDDRELAIEQTEVSVSAASASDSPATDDVSHADSLTLPSHSNQSLPRPSTSQLSIPLSPPHPSHSLRSTYDICDIPSAPPLQDEQPSQSLPQTLTPSTPTASKRDKPLVSAVASPIATKAAPPTPAPADLTSSRRTTRASAASDARRTSLPAVIPSSPKAKKNVPESEQQVAQSRARKTTRAASPAAKEDIPERRSISRTRKSTAEETTTSPVAKKALPEAVTSPRVAKKPIQDTAVVASPRAKKTAPEPIASPRRSRRTASDVATPESSEATEAVISDAVIDIPAPPPDDVPMSVDTTPVSTPISPVGKRVVTSSRAKRTVQFITAAPPPPPNPKTRAQPTRKSTRGTKKNAMSFDMVEQNAATRLNRVTHKTPLIGASSSQTGDGVTLLANVLEIGKTFAELQNLLTHDQFKAIGKIDPVNFGKVLVERLISMESTDPWPVLASYYNRKGAIPYPLHQKDTDALIALVDSLAAERRYHVWEEFARQLAVKWQRQSQWNVSQAQGATYSRMLTFALRNSVDGEIVDGCLPPAILKGLVLCIVNSDRAFIFRYMCFMMTTDKNVFQQVIQLIEQDVYLSQVMLLLRSRSDVSVRIYDWIYGNFFSTTPSSSDLSTILARLVPSSSPDYNPLLEGIDKFVSERAFSISQKDKNEFEGKMYVHAWFLLWKCAFLSEAVEWKDTTRFLDGLVKYAYEFIQIVIEGTQGKKELPDKANLSLFNKIDDFMDPQRPSRVFTEDEFLRFWVILLPFILRESNIQKGY